MATEVPYSVEVRIWRDEQPGDEPKLYVSARFLPYPNKALWKELALTYLDIHAGEEVWTPEKSGLEMLANGSFMITAEGEPTMAAGISASLTLHLQSNDGDKDLVLPASMIELIE